MFFILFGWWQLVKWRYKLPAIVTCSYRPRVTWYALILPHIWVWVAHCMCAHHTFTCYTQSGTLWCSWPYRYTQLAALHIDLGLESGPLLSWDLHHLCLTLMIIKSVMAIYVSCQLVIFIKITILTTFRSCPLLFSAGLHQTVRDWLCGIPVERFHIPPLACTSGLLTSALYNNYFLIYLRWSQHSYFTSINLFFHNLLNRRRLKKKQLCTYIENRYVLVNE